MKQDTINAIKEIISAHMKPHIDRLEMGQIELNYKCSRVAPDAKHDLELLSPMVKIPSLLIENTAYSIKRNSENRNLQGWISFDTLSKKVKKSIFDIHYCGKRVHEDMQWLSIFQSLCVMCKLYTSNHKLNLNVRNTWYVETTQGVKFHPELIKHLVNIYVVEPKAIEDRLGFLI